MPLLEASLTTEIEVVSDIISERVVLKKHYS